MAVVAEDEPWEVSWCWFEDAKSLTERGERERERPVDENRPSFWVMGQGDVFIFYFIFFHMGLLVNAGEGDHFGRTVLGRFINIYISKNIYLDSENG